MKHLDYIDLSLSRIKNCLESMGNPQDRIKNIIHIAGTNGKGSTTSFIRYILEENGYSVNVYTSPHLVSYNERFRIKGKLITNKQLEKVQAKLSNIKGYKELSIFEATTVIAFVIFLENKADFTILETGLGGRLDATNVIKNPILNLFTSISYDHQNFLGNTLDKIAFEKFGIMKKKAIVVSDYQDGIVIRGLKYMLKKHCMKGIVGGEDYIIEGILLKYKNKVFNLTSLGLRGEHQKNNASLAIVAVLNIKDIKLEDRKIIRALEKTQWFGRMQKVSSLYGTTFDSKTTLYLDGCHNVAGMIVLKQFIKDTYQCDYKQDSINKDTSFQDIEKVVKPRKDLTLSTDLNLSINLGECQVQGGNQEETKALEISQLCINNNASLGGIDNQKHTFNNNTNVITEQSPRLRLIPPSASSIKTSSVMIGAIKKDQNAHLTKVYGENQNLKLNQVLMKFSDSSSNPHPHPHPHPHIYIMLGMLSKKDIRLCLEEIKGVNPIILPLKVEEHESYSIEEIKGICEELGIKTQGDGDITQNLKNICKNTHKKVIFICGSLYLIGKILKDNNILQS